MIIRGGRSGVFLGTRECQACVEPCVFGQGDGFYDDLPQLAFGVMYHGITCADEAYDEATAGRMTVNLWRPVMEKGIIRFPKLEACPVKKVVKTMPMKAFGEAQQNFSGLREFGEVT